MNWDKYRNFSKSEFDCKHTGKNRMRPEFMDMLQQIRTAWGKPMVVNSGYRDKSHRVEARKPEPGEHSYGLAADIDVSGQDAIELLMIAYGHGIRRLGIYQNPKMKFLHIGMGDKELNFPSAIWTP